jgi:hypothetical protein
VPLRSRLNTHSVEYHNLSSQGPSQGDEGYEDDCDDSDEAKATVKIKHDVQYLHVPAWATCDLRTERRVTCEQNQASFRQAPRVPAVQGDHD